MTSNDSRKYVILGVIGMLLAIALLFACNQITRNYKAEHAVEKVGEASAYCQYGQSVEQTRSYQEIQNKRAELTNEWAKKTAPYSHKEIARLTYPNSETKIPKLCNLVNEAGNLLEYADADRRIKAFDIASEALNFQASLINEQLAIYNSAYGALSMILHAEDNIASARRQIRNVSPWDVYEVDLRKANDNLELAMRRLDDAWKYMTIGNWVEAENRGRDTSRSANDAYGYASTPTPTSTPKPTATSTPRPTRTPSSR